MPLAAFDSNIAIWSIKNDSLPTQLQERQKAANLKLLLSKNGFDILIPMPVGSELMSNINDASERLRFLNEIRKTFQIADFDAKAAIILAEILNFHYQNKNNYQSLGITKTSLKYDALIIAISKAAGAECLYAHDPDCKKIAAHFYPVKGLDDVPDSISPTNFFGKVT